MDPRATIKYWLESYEENYPYDMRDAADAYNEWVARGGAPFRRTIDREVYTVWSLGRSNDEGSTIQRGLNKLDRYNSPHKIAWILFG
jgi:hypothetical protein